MKKRREVKKDFDYYIDEYLYYCQSRRLRPKTLSSYEQTLRLFERWLRESEEVDHPADVREQTIRKYICEIQDRGKYTFCVRDEQCSTNCPDRRRDYREPVSITTINNYIRNLRAFFNWFTEDLPAKDNPMRRIRQLENDRKARDYLEDIEIKKLLDGFDKSYFSEARDSMIIALMLDTGMRLGECLQIKVEQLDMVECVIELPAEVTKGRKSRAVFFSSKTARMLQRWLRYKDRYVETTYLFPIKSSGLPVEIGTFETNFRKYVERSGIKKEVSPHVLRNNFAKRCLMAGMDIFSLSRILGHSSVMVTEKAYLDLTDTDLRRRYQNFSPMENLR